MSASLLNHYSVSQLLEIAKHFELELMAAEQGQATSLQFYRHPPVQANGSFPENKFQILTIGGSILKTAHVQVRDGQKHIEDYQEQILPILSSKSILFELLWLHLDPEVVQVALNFAFPVQPFIRDNRLDGKLLKGAKEHNLVGLVGQNIGEEFEQFCLTRGRTLRVACANDTICLLMSGLELSTAEHLVGGVIGTGANLGLFLSDGTAVNLESGNFNKFEPSQAAKYIDQNSTNPHNQLFEKEVSGGYLYKHYNYWLTENQVEGGQLETTNELNGVANADNLSFECQLAQRLIQRSASLFAAQIAGVYAYKHQPKLLVVMEGSLFWHSHRYLETVEKTLQDMDISSPAIKFVHLDKSGIYGALHLVF